MERVLDIDGQEWRVRALPDVVKRKEADSWHWARVRFEPLSRPESPSREAWLRLEEDVPFRNVLDQYEDAELEETFLVAEEVAEEVGEDVEAGPPGGATGDSPGGTTGDSPGGATGDSPGRPPGDSPGGAPGGPSGA